MREHPYIVIVLTLFLLGSVAGYVMHRSDFCIAGMFRDLFLFRNTLMLRMLVLWLQRSRVVNQVAMAKT
jgi:hypothetical protein